MSDEELCKRLVDWSEHDEGKINDARQEAKLRIEALEQQVADLLADVPCACGYDNPTDVCMKHLPLVRDLTAKLAKAVEGLQAFKAFDEMPTRYKRPDVFEVSVRRKLLSTLAEIEGEKT
jgi:hypothetical protein